MGLGRVKWLERGEKLSDPAAELAKSKFHNTVDPAPAFDPSSGHSIAELRRIILSSSESLFSRYQALYSLRNAAIGTGSGKNSEPSDVVEALSSAATAPGSALLRHQVAFVLGELGIPRTGDSLIGRLQDAKEAAWVRHESALALGKLVEAAEVEEKEGRATCAGFAQRGRQALLVGSKDSEPVVRDSCALALKMPDYKA